MHARAKGQLIGKKGQKAEWEFFLGVTDEKSGDTHCSLLTVEP